MYNRFFGFKERPFKLVPNPAYVYLSRVHEEVLAHLNYAVGYGEGFVEITGEVGTGKTTLCRMFLENLDENTVAGYIFNPKLDALQLLKAINDEFGIPSDSDSLKTLIDRLNVFLLDQKAQDKRVLLLVDEAQNLSADVLEQLRLLSNLETATSKLVQIILVGQPELGELLETDALRQLNQRINLSCHLIPLRYSETCEYIRHRIHIASYKPGLEFTPGAYRAIFNHTNGVPRLINIACDRALLTAFTLGRHRITKRIVKRALRELDGKNRRSRRPLLFRETLIIGLLVVLVILVAGLVVSQTLLNRGGGSSVDPVVHHKIEKPTHTSSPAVSAEATADQDPALQATVAAGPLPAPLSPPTGPPATKALLPDAADPGVTAATASPQSLPVYDLLQAIASADSLSSRSDALMAVLGQWNAQPPPDHLEIEGVGNDTFFRLSARQVAMETLRVQGSLELIRRLNLPAIFEFPHPDGNGSRYMAVVGLSADEVRLSNGGTTFSVAPESLAGLWNGVAHILWKNFYDYTGVIPISSPGDVILSLKMHLKSLGFPIESMSAAYDISTRSAVETIQARHGLDVDGMVGPQTKIALYNEDLSLTVPRLADPPRG
jgi:general secretion pathway protein A